MIDAKGGGFLFFEYGDKAVAYLKGRDKRLSEAIDRIGRIERSVDDDLFCAVVRSIVGQQISSAAQQTIWNRMTGALGAITPETIAPLSVEQIQRFGMSFRKAEYIRDFAMQVHFGAFDIEAVRVQSDAQLIETLSKLKGIGIWTAEMIMIFCLQRPDIMSFGDLAIVRGLRMLHRHRKIDRPLFEKYQKRYSPYGSVASLYLWAVAGGALPELTDPAPKKPKKVNA